MGSLMREASLLGERDFIPMDVTRKMESSAYFVDGHLVKSSRLFPVPDYPLRAGVWRIDNFKGAYGREIEKLLLVSPRALVLTEEDYTKVNHEGRGEDAQRYAEWMRQGLVAPPVGVVETDKGNLSVTNGHRRVAAAIMAHKRILAWVSPRMDIGMRTPEGEPIYAGLTFEGSRRA